MKTSPINLISHVGVRKASISDVDFLQDGIEKSQEVFPDKMEAEHVDGAYHSPDNQQYCKDNGIELYLQPYKGQKKGISSIFRKIVNTGKYSFLNGAPVSVCFN